METIPKRVTSVLTEMQGWKRRQEISSQDMKGLTEVVRRCDRGIQVNVEEINISNGGMSSFADKHTK